MRLLFAMDKRDYDDATPRFRRPSVRGIIIRDGKIAMIHSTKYDYYKFPGGGIEEGEDHVETLCREVWEEAGLHVVPASVREYGYVHRVQMGDRLDVFVQDNFYYFCAVDANAGTQNLDDYEAEEGFVPVWIAPEEVIKVNRASSVRGKAGDRTFGYMLEREAKVLEMLRDEGYF